jgi:hypothetical protein
MGPKGPALVRFHVIKKEKKEKKKNLEMGWVIRVWQNIENKFK